MSKDVLVKVNNLVKNFSVTNSHGGKKSVVQAVSDVNFEIFRGETLSLVGESGCGKSTLGRLLINLIDPTSGSVMFEGTDLVGLKSYELRELR